MHWRDHLRSNCPETRAVREILEDLTDRDGFDNVWANIDLRTQMQIMDRWMDLVRREITEYRGPG